MHGIMACKVVKVTKGCDVSTLSDAMNDSVQRPQLAERKAVDWIRLSSWRQLEERASSCARRMVFCVLLASCGIGVASAKVRDTDADDVKITIHANDVVFLKQGRIAFSVVNNRLADIHFTCVLEGRLRSEWRELAYDVTNPGISMKEEVFRAIAGREERLSFVPIQKIDVITIESMRGKPYRLSCSWSPTLDGVGGGGMKVVSSEFYVRP